MTATAMSTTVKDALVGMGQIVAGKSPERMKSVLGSCIGLAIYHPRLKAGAMAHIVLPDSAGRDGAPGKFADTAIPAMLKMLQQLGVPAHGLTAKMAGGANMFNGTGPLQIGDANAVAVVQALEAAGIRLAGREVGGTKGRRVIFDCTCGTVTVECTGQPTQTL